jgi:hypothetical protein
MRILIVLTLIAVATATAIGQTFTAQTRAQEIAAAFNKHKSVVKEKFGVRREKYKDVQSEPTIKGNISEYSGRYEVSELGLAIDIQAVSNGAVHASLYENSQPSQIRLENARIEGALLTANKINEDGSTEKFEGVFLTRTDRNSPTDKGVTTFGLGVLLTRPIEFSGNTYEKLFYQQVK